MSSRALLTEDGLVSALEDASLAEDMDIASYARCLRDLAQALNERADLAEEEAKHER
jgi:hypothetical protein